MTAIAHTRRLATVRNLDVPTFNQKLEELNVILREVQQQIAESRGISGPDSMTLGRHLDMGGKRLQGVGPTRADTDVPNVSELRRNGLYVKGDQHETDKLIYARGGIRTITPAVAPNDVITLGQVQRLLGNSNISQSGNNSSVNGGLNYTQQAVTLPNGLTSDWAVPDRVYLRITGPTAAFAIGGFQTIGDGRMLILQNATTQDMTITNEDLATAAAHRIQTGTGGDLVMSGRGTTSFLYSVLDARWIVL